jgi:hypothetical protein
MQCETANQTSAIRCKENYIWLTNWDFTLPVALQYPTNRIASEIARYPWLGSTVVKGGNRSQQRVIKYR